jgi:hypothetical protein
MFFIIRSTSPDSDLAIYRAKKSSRLKLASHTFGPAELLLSRYLQENYGKSLLVACIEIINNAKYNLNFDREIVVTISDKTLNDIAKIITYGNLTLAGSRILRDIFTI